MPALTVSPGRPAHPAHRAAVDRAVASYRSLGDFKVEPGPELPDGMVDLFEHWRWRSPATPICARPRRRRSLPQGPRALPRPGARPDRRQAPGRCGRQRAVAGAPDRPPGGPRRPGRGKEDHVLWVNACAGDGALLMAPIGGTPEDYARHSTNLQQASGPAADRTRALLSILCTFQASSSPAASVSTRPARRPTAARWSWRMRGRWSSIPRGQGRGPMEQRLEPGEPRRELEERRPGQLPGREPQQERPWQSQRQPGFPSREHRFKARTGSCPIHRDPCPARAGTKP